MLCVHLQADKDLLPKLKSKVEVFTAVVNPGDVLVVPWGNIVAEKTLNNADVLGLRHLAVQKVSAADFDHLCMFLVPELDVPAPTVNSDTQAAFLVGIQKALKDFATANTMKPSEVNEKMAKVQMIKAEPKGQKRARPA